MRADIALVFYLASFAYIAHAEITPETVRTTTLAAPQPTWVIVKNIRGSAFVFDLQSGEMHGTLSLTTYTPAVQPNVTRGEIYAAERYYSRLYRGERTDVLTIYDLKTLSAREEIKIPTKIASLSFRQYIGLLGDDRHVAVFNMTPAQSVSIVDVLDKAFVGEISTPGCALVAPAANRGFLMICGDGTLQLIQLDRRGLESGRHRSHVFFSGEDDPVFDKPIPTSTGWLLVSFEGKVFDVQVDGEEISISESWSLLSEEDVEESWRVGGGQIVTLHQGLDVLYALMHQGGPDTHEDAGSEVWLFNRKTHRRIARVALESPGTNIFVTQNDTPLLAVSTEAGQLDVYDAIATKKLRAIDPGLPTVLIQGF